MTEHRLDPLGDLEVKRVLAFARAREQYPSVPRGLLLDYCQAAWQAAIAGGDDGDVVGRFERALMMVAWTHRRSPHLSFRDLVDQVIPQVALRPFMSPEDGLAAEEPAEEPVVEAEPAVRPDAPRPPARRLLPRVPFASPIPLGAAVAAGFIGVTVLGQSGALPVAPFAPAGNDDASPNGDAHHGDKASAAPAVHPAAGGGSGFASAPATGTRIGVAAAPHAAEAFRAPAVTTGGGGADAPTAPAEPAKAVSAPVSAPASAPAAPAQTAPAAPVDLPRVVDEVDQQAPDTGGAEELAQAPEKHHGSWKGEPDAQLPEQAPATAPAEPTPDTEVTAPDVQREAPGVGNGEEHGAERHQHSDRFAPIGLDQAGQGDSAPGQDDSAPAADDSAPAQETPAPQPPAEVKSAPEPAANAPAPKPALDVPKPAQVGPPAAPQQQGGQAQPTG